MNPVLVQKLRDDTDGVRHVLHFNNAGSSLPPRPVLQCGKNYLDLEASIGGYEAVGQSMDAMQAPYVALAALLQCQSSEIAIVTSATAAWQQVVYGLAWQWKPGDWLLTSVAEYGSNFIAFLQIKKRTGIEIVVIPETEESDVDLEALEILILDNPKPVLISITHIPTSSGRVYDAEGVGKLANKHGILFMLDACQTVGQMPLDVQRIGCHFLTGTGRKYLRAPRGSGFLYVSRHALNEFEPATIDNTGASWTSTSTYTLQPSAKRFESYEMCFAAKVGLGAAVKYCVTLGIDAIWQRIQHLSQLLRRSLARLPGVCVFDHGKVLCGIVSFTKDDLSADHIKEQLRQQYKINVSISAIASTRLDFEKRGLSEVVRASVHYFNTEEEVHMLVEAVHNISANIG